MRFGCVVLTTGDRPEALQRALASVRAQRGVEVQTVVVVNAEAGGELPGDGEGVADGDDVTVVRPGRNLGIPAGRNLGVERLDDDVELVLFLDDDAFLLGDDVLAQVVARFVTDPSLGAVSLRIKDPVTGLTERRHVPRLRVGDPGRSSWVTSFLGGASVLRRVAFDRAGGLPAEFFYAHEETSLAWRVLDLGYRIRYLGDACVAHPALPPARHAVYHHLTARNRVLLARKHLPGPLAVVYVALWAVLGLLRSPGGRLALLRGFRDGLRHPGVVRAPIQWRTVARMARYGRPPLL